jgi:hypothetical protein
MVVRMGFHQARARVCAPASKLASVFIVFAALSHSPAALAGRYDARNGDECRTQVNANYDAITARMRADGNLTGIAVVNRRGRDIELAECAQMDRSAQDATMTKGYRRLSAAVDSLRAQVQVAAGERRTIAAEYTTISTFPPAPYRDAYLRLHADFLRYTELNRAGVPPGESCDAIRSLAAASRREHDAAVAALLESHATAGETNWRQFEARRVAALSEMTWQGDRARMAGCSSQ